MLKIENFTLILGGKAMTSYIRSGSVESWFQRINEINNPMFPNIKLPIVY